MWGLGSSHIPLKLQESPNLDLWIDPIAVSQVSPKVPGLGWYFTCFLFLLQIFSVLSTGNIDLCYVLLMGNYGCDFILYDHSKVESWFLHWKTKDFRLNWSRKKHSIIMGNTHMTSTLRGMGVCEAKMRCYWA